MSFAVDSFAKSTVVQWAVLVLILSSGAMASSLPPQSKLGGQPTYTYSEGSTKHWIVLHQEKQQWRVYHYAAEQGQMQDLVEQKKFSDDRDLRNYLRHLSGKVGPISAPLMPNALTVAPVREALYTEDSTQVIWPTTQSWTVAWEHRYALWVEENIDRDFFQRNNLATDCADVPFVVRWIFARENGLPVAHHLAGSNRLVSNESFRRAWRQFRTDPDWRKDERFLAALRYVIDNTYTHSLYLDSYPIALSPHSLRAGAFLLELRDSSGHTKLVDHTNFSDPEALPFTLLYSDVPQKIRTLMEGDHWVKEQPSTEAGGFVQFRWPEIDAGRVGLRPREQMYNHSLEQFEESFHDEESFYESLLQRLKPNYSIAVKVKRGIHYITQQIENRIEVVNQGYAYCQRRRCTKGTSAYNDWSTPSRDKRLRDTLLEIEAFVARSKNPEAERLWRDAQQRVEFLILDQEVSLGLVSFLFRTVRYKSDPEAPPHERWGLSTHFVDGI